MIGFLKSLQYKHLTGCISKYDTSLFCQEKRKVVTLSQPILILKKYSRLFFSPGRINQATFYAFDHRLPEARLAP